MRNLVSAWIVVVVVASACTGAEIDEGSDDSADVGGSVISCRIVDATGRTKFADPEHREQQAFERAGDALAFAGSVGFKLIVTPMESGDTLAGDVRLQFQRLASPAADAWMSFLADQELVAFGLVELDANPPFDIGIECTR